MGSSTWTTSCYNAVLTSRGFDTKDVILDCSTSTQEVFSSTHMKETMNVRDKVRECCETEEHPNTIPIIIGLDVTGSMNNACKSCLAGINDTIVKLYENYKDVEIAVAGIGDFVYDHSPFQLSQFESDVRIADNLFDIFIENGGGFNNWESYTAAWYAGLYHTRLDCWNRGQKGIIITMGDELLNPALPKEVIQQVFGDVEQDDVDTQELYDKICEKYEVYHISITDKSTYSRRANKIDNSWGQVIGDHYKKSTCEDLSKTICEIVDDAIGTVNSNNEEISW